MEAIVGNFVQDNAVVDAVFEELIALYEGVELVTLVDGTLAIAMDNLTGSVADVLEAVIPGHEAKVQHSEELVKYLVAGSIGAPALEETATVGGALALVKEIVSDYVESEELEAVFDELSALFAEVVIANVGEDTLALDIDDVIDTINNITNVFVTNEVLDTIYAVAHAGLYGTLGNLGFDPLAAYEEMPQTAQIVTIAALATTVGVLYVAANDTLVDLVGQFLGEDAVIGDYIAEPL